jgi:hypothetical protein
LISVAGFLVAHPVFEGGKGPVASPHQTLWAHIPKQLRYDRCRISVWLDAETAGYLDPGLSAFNCTQDGHETFRIAAASCFGSPHMIDDKTRSCAFNRRDIVRQPCRIIMKVNMPSKIGGPLHKDLILVRLQIRNIRHIAKLQSNADNAGVIHAAKLVYTSPWIDNDGGSKPFVATHRL